MYNDVCCEITVKDMKLYPVTVFCNRKQEEWSSESNVVFHWEPNKKNDFLVGYVMNFNQISNYIPELGKDYYEHENGLKTFNAKIFDISGEYYFHIQGFDKYYNKTPVVHYKILYNNPPDPPTELSLNGIRFFKNGEKISKFEKNLFSWTHSYDKDENDFGNLKYELVICKKSNFENVDYNSGLINKNYFELNFDNQSFFGKIFWKVRSYDGKQYSDWSRISSFEVNNEPTVPTDIKFFKKN